MEEEVQRVEVIDEAVRGGMGWASRWGTYSPARVVPSLAQTRLRGRRAAEVRMEARDRARVRERVKAGMFGRGRVEGVSMRKKMKWGDGLFIR